MPVLTCSPKVHFLAHGKVQGVFYRKYAIERATARGLTGWVQNLPNGKVEGEAQGSESEVEGFLKDLDRGPPRAQVVRLDRTEREVLPVESEGQGGGFVKRRYNDGGI